MPYIKKPDRTKYREILKQLPKIETKGDLDYCAFYLILKFMSTREQRFSEIHDAVYAVHHAADEYHRRFLDKREDKAIEINGDVEL